ncbi:NUC189-domain-containing protein [Westerdykella ornata]|uniref:NUC189-domain-containing protein n=1 Tax=Westerdykella ornata TaxID=318751 RepID=A0A6A6J9R3_WESOR|nr:NUC189-domain-containing protein [Westerdykella ornata]KAF2273311.1 NUC189-domain-containing protein [Westerdykella ornata]
MPATVASRSRPPTKKARASNDSLPPAKKTKLAQTPSASHSTGYSALLNGTPGKKPVVAAKINGVRNSRKDKVDEATAVVGDALEEVDDVEMPDVNKSVIEISSADETSDDSGSDDEDDQEAGHVAENGLIDTNGHTEDGEAAADELEEPSLGEKLQAQEPEAVRTAVVDVEEAFGQDVDARALATNPTNRPLAPSTNSLGTVLAQALRTNDKDLLNSALRITDVDSIYATVERLPSPLVANLLQKLAEHLYKKPSRAGILMVWLQVALSAHGGYLASQPQLVKQLASLNRVLQLRGAGLQPLLQLKGRLDMLQAQLELRKRNQRRAAIDEEDEAVIYVEGEDDVSSADEDDADSELGSDVAGKVPEGSDEDETSSVDHMPTTMEMDEATEEDSGNDDLLDDEAEETDDDDGDDMSEPMSDDDIDGEDAASASEEESRPARRSTAGRAGTTRRY